MKQILIILLVITGVFLSSCSTEEEPKKKLEIPTAYESPEFDTTTYQERMLATRLSNLVSMIKQGENPANTLDLNTLMAAWTEGGNAGLKFNSGAIGASIEGYLLQDLAKNSGKTYHPDFGDTATLGGVFESRLLNEGAFELLQAVDKGSYAGLFIYQILKLEEENLDLKTLDRILALYGANPSFPNTPTAAKTPKPDKFIANYVARRDKNDGTGFYSQIKTEFLTIQAAIQAGEGYVIEKDAAFSRLIQTMEKALAATSINYMYSAITKLSKTNPTDADKAGALHDLSEAFGFIIGFANLNSPYITINNSQISTFETFLHVNGQNYSFYEFTNDPVNNLPDLLKAIDHLQSVYKFTESEMIDFKTNWVSAQNR